MLERERSGCSWINIKSLSKIVTLMLICSYVGDEYTFTLKYFLYFSTYAKVINNKNLWVYRKKEWSWKLSLYNPEWFTDYHSDYCPLVQRALIISPIDSYNWWIQDPNRSKGLLMAFMKVSTYLDIKPRKFKQHFWNLNNII